MNKDLIPQSVHHLIPLVEEWGIGDDGYRDEKIEHATTEELEHLVNSFTDKDADHLNEWLIDPQLLKSPTQEYLDFSAFFMAYEYANAVLKSRRN
jgi:hypothetical protein